MRYAKFGNTDMVVSEIALGTWGIGGTSWDDNSEDTRLDAIRSAAESGINFIYYDLGTKLSWISRFTSHNRTNMRLIDADDAVFNLMTLPHIQVPLLATEFLDHQQLPV